MARNAWAPRGVYTYTWIAPVRAVRHHDVTVGTGYER